MNINVNPNVLQWARDEAGFSMQELCRRLKVAEERYTRWEKDGTEIPWGKLCQISQLFKRQVAVFFLESVPPVVKKPKDYRNFRLSSGGVSSDILLAIRRVSKYLRVMTEIFGEKYWLDRYDWLIQDVAKQINIDKQYSSRFYQWLRDEIDVTLESQRKTRRISDSLKDWRTRIENNLGIFIFQFKMPKDEVQAFCYGEKPPFGIVLNSNSYYSTRIFSIFHELAHIFHSQSGICYPDEVDKHQSFELECNEFAGKFLVPDEYVPRANNLEMLSEYADDFNVSREVILRRNLEREYITKKQFFELLGEIRQLPILKRKGGFIKPIDKSRNSRGDMFFNMIMEAMNANKIDYSTTADMLGLRIKYLI